MDALLHRLSVSYDTLSSQLIFYNYLTLILYNMLLYFSEFGILRTLRLRLDSCISSRAYIALELNKI